jgi:hypothetical protein
MFVLLLVVMLISCTYTKEKMVDGLPLLEKIKSNKEMDEITKRGMFDGCFTGYHSRGSSFYKTALYFRQDPKMASDDKYNFAWGRGYTACFSEALVWTYMPIGGKAINSNLMTAISPLNEKVTSPIGNDTESQPAVWYFDESVNRGIPGTANYGTNYDFFGVFGSCIWC